MSCLVEADQPDNGTASPNLLASLLISLFAVFLVVLLGIILLCFYLRRRGHRQQQKDGSMQPPPIHFIDQPPLYAERATSA